MSKFEPQFNVLLEHLNNPDHGLAKTLHDKIRENVLATIEDEGIKQQFIDLHVENRNNGLFATEKVLIKSLAESNKANVLMSLNLLKIFGKLEYVRYKFTSGPNPEVDPTSYISTSRRISKDLPEEYKGDFNEISTFRLLDKILLNKFDKDNNYVEPTLDDISDNNLVYKGQWPQYTDYSTYEKEELEKLNSIVITDIEFKNELINSRKENLEDEFTSINEESLLSDEKVPNTNSYKIRSVKNQDGDIVNTDIENNYTIEIKKAEDGGRLIIANLKPDLSAPNNVLINEDGTKKFEESFLTGSTSLGTISYVSNLLPLLLTDGILTLTNLIEWIGNTNKILGDLMVKNISNFFEFMDPELNDELKAYYYLEDEMVFNGNCNVEKDLIKINFKINNGIATYDSNITDNTDIAFAKNIIEFMSISMNSYTKLLDFYKKFLIKLMNPTSVVTAFAEYSTMAWLQNIYNKTNIYNNLSSNDGTIKNSVLIDNNMVNNDINDIVEFYESLINKFITQINACYNANLTKI